MDLFRIIGTKRRPNFTREELSTLMAEVQSKKHIIFSKCCSRTTNSAKLEEWAAIAGKVNEVSIFGDRTPHEIRRKWITWQSDTKKAARLKRNVKWAHGDGDILRITPITDSMAEESGISPSRESPDVSQENVSEASSVTDFPREPSANLVFPISAPMPVIQAGSVVSIVDTSESDLQRTILIDDNHSVDHRQHSDTSDVTRHSPSIKVDYNISGDVSLRSRVSSDEHSVELLSIERQKLQIERERLRVERELLGLVAIERERLRVEKERLQIEKRRLDLLEQQASPHGNAPNQFALISAILNAVNSTYGQHNN